MALGALQAFGALAVLERLLVIRANQNVEQIFSDHVANFTMKSAFTTETQRPLRNERKEKTDWT
jgi:hypothetical protein